MRTMTLVLAATVLLAIGFSGQAGHGAQSGDNSDCLDYNVLYLVDGVHSPAAAFASAHAGSFSISSSSGVAFIDFYDAGGAWLGWNGGNPTGNAPTGTAYGTVCVGATGAYPDAPEPLATWTFTQ